MYSRIEGQSGDAQTGAVLADAMGLGRAYTCTPVTNTTPAACRIRHASTLLAHDLRKL